ncbi:MAG: Gfo/Idh/MocA family oxidoreductase [Clostridia bacterium]|nr:Gfo/Idh/MocA family oxidoreductase [Clostridia bacterium]
MNKIKIAQIGTSRYSHGSAIFESIKRNSDIFEIVGFSLPENEREKFPEQMEFFDAYREMTVDEILNNPEIDAVTVETEEIYLTKYAQMVADAKKHMHMEKPGGTDEKAFEKLIETIKKNGTVFHIGYMYRYNPYILELMESIRKGELGDIISVEAQMNCIHSEELRQWLNNFDGGMMFFLGCHLIDLILQIQGTPENVIPLNKCSGIGDGVGTDLGMAVFEYKNGISFAKTSAVEIGGFERRQLVVSGTKGTVELRPLERLTYDYKMQDTDRYIRTDTNWHAHTQKTTSPIHNRYDSMMASFGAMIRGEKENPWTYDYELKLYKTLLRACGKF